MWWWGGGSSEIVVVGGGENVGLGESVVVEVVRMWGWVKV